MPRGSASASWTTAWSFTASLSTATAAKTTPSFKAIAAARIAALVALTVACVPLHLGAKLLTGGSRWPKRFLACAAWICGARVRLAGRAPGPHSLLICNHVSWLDVLVLGGATGCAFVSKDNLGHSLVHWLADQGGTLYVRRDHRKGAPGQAEAISRKLREPQPLALFPESTTGPGHELLPFRSSLFSAVAPPPPSVEVRPVAIDYGENAPELGWYEEPGKDNVLRVLGWARTTPVTIRLLDPLPALSDRKVMAAAARDAIAQALTSSRASTRL